MKNHKTLLVWQKAYELSLKVYKLTQSFPGEERFGLTSHIRRTATSIPSNIAEGCGRDGNRELHRFMSIACGSLNELDCQLMIAHDMEYISDDVYNELDALLIEVSKMLTTYMSKLELDARR